MIFISERNPIDLQQWFLQVNVPPVSQIHSQREALSRLPNADPSYLAYSEMKLSTIFVNACNSSGQRTEALSVQPSASPAAQVSQVEILFSPPLRPRQRQQQQPQLRRL